MTGTNRSAFKRTKMGKVSGDLPIRVKARMLERRDPFVMSWGQVISENCIKSFRKDFAKLARKRSRRIRKEERNAQ